MKNTCELMTLKKKHISLSNVEHDNIITAKTILIVMIINKNSI